MPGKVRNTLARHAGDEKKGFAKESEPLFVFQVVLFFCYEQRKDRRFHQGKGMRFRKPREGGRGDDFFRQDPVRRDRQNVKNDRRRFCGGKRVFR